MGRIPNFRHPNPVFVERGHGHPRNANSRNHLPSGNQNAGSGNGNNKWKKPNQNFSPGNQNTGKVLNIVPWNKPNQPSGFRNQNAGKGFNVVPWNKPNHSSGFGNQNVGKGFNNNNNSNNSNNSNNNPLGNKFKRENRPRSVFTGKGGNRWGFNQGNQSPKDVVMEDVFSTPWGLGKMDISSPPPRWGKPPSSDKRVAWTSSKDVSVLDIGISQLNGFQKAQLDEKNVQVRLENQHLSLNGCYEVQITQTVAVYKLGGPQDEIRVLDFPNLKEKRYDHLLARRKVATRRKAFSKRQVRKRPKDSRRTGVPRYQAYKPLTKRIDQPKDRVFKKYRYWRKKVRPNQKVFGIVP